MPLMFRRQPHVTPQQRISLRPNMSRHALHVPTPPASSWQLLPRQCMITAHGLQRGPVCGCWAWGRDRSAISVLCSASTSTLAICSTSASGSCCAGGRGGAAPGAGSPPGPLTPTLPTGGPVAPGTAGGTATRRAHVDQSHNGLTRPDREPHISRSNIYGVNAARVS